jgi:Zn finger protein HypA/HybF involved in hydrogenase expression
MHEEALLADLRRKLVELGRQHHATRIAGVSVWMGALTHLTESQLRARWPGTVEGTAAEGSTLRVERSEDPSDARATAIVLQRIELGGA